MRVDVVQTRSTLYLDYNVSHAICANTEIKGLENWVFNLGH